MRTEATARRSWPRPLRTPARHRDAMLRMPEASRAVVVRAVRVRAEVRGPLTRQAGGHGGREKVAGERARAPEARDERCPRASARARAARANLLRKRKRRES